MNFVNLCLQKRYKNNFFSNLTLLFLFLHQGSKTWDPGWIKIMILNPEINIQDLQHCGLLAITNSLLYFFLCFRKVVFDLILDGEVFYHSWRVWNRQCAAFCIFDSLQISSIQWHLECCVPSCSALLPNLMKTEPVQIIAKKIKHLRLTKLFAPYAKSLPPSARRCTC